MSPISKNALVAETAKRVLSGEVPYDDLHDLLNPALCRIASRIASQSTVDAVQAAHIKIWRKLHRIDLDKPGTVMPFMLKVGVSAMRDEINKFRRLRTHDIEIPEEWELPEKEKSKSKFDFEGVLKLYLKYIEEHGTMNNAHREIAKKTGMSISRVTVMFHAAASEFIKDNGLRKGHKSDDIFDSLFGYNKKSSGGSKRGSRR